MLVTALLRGPAYSHHIKRLLIQAIASDLAEGFYGGARKCVGDATVETVAVCGDEFYGEGGGEDFLDLTGTAHGGRGGEGRGMIEQKWENWSEKIESGARQDVGGW